MKIAQLCLGITISVAVLAPIYAGAATEPTQSCKNCVMKCVMEKNKEGRDCLHVHPYAPGGECDTQCAGVDRKSLMQKLREEARAKCTQDYTTCMNESGGDALKQNVCALNKGVCDQRVSTKMF